MIHTASKCCYYSICVHIPADAAGIERVVAGMIAHPASCGVQLEASAALQALASECLYVKDILARLGVIRCLFFFLVRSTVCVRPTASVASAVLDTLDTLVYLIHLPLRPADAGRVHSRCLVTILIIALFSTSTCHR
jgi:hypothetical protein